MLFVITLVCDLDNFIFSFLFQSLFPYTSISVLDEEKYSPETWYDMTVVDHSNDMQCVLFLVIQ